jgi:hypothetical protein
MLEDDSQLVMNLNVSLVRAYIVVYSVSQGKIDLQYDAASRRKLLIKFMGMNWSDTELIGRQGK